VKTEEESGMPAVSRRHPKRITWFPEVLRPWSWQTVATGFLKSLRPKGATRKLVQQPRSTHVAIANTGLVFAARLPPAGMYPPSKGEAGAIQGLAALQVEKIITDSRQGACPSRLAWRGASLALNS